MNRHAISSLARLALATTLICWPTLVWPAPPYTAGTVLVSRNADERENTSPGYWNHTAVYIGNQQIVESQAGQGVILTSVDEFLSRQYSRIIALAPRDALAGEQAAQRAQRLVGLRHAPGSSFFPFQGPLRQRMGLNCVSIVEISWQARFNIPDQAFRFRRVFLPAETVR